MRVTTVKRLPRRKDFDRERFRREADALWRDLRELRTVLEARRLRAALTSEATDGD